MKSFEKIADPETETGIEGLRTFIATLAETTRGSGVPVNDDGRIDMLAYKDLYPNAERDFAATREGRPDAGAILEERLQTDGEKLEMLAYAILHKNFGRDFIVARSAPYDDKVNHVDTLVFEKATGNLVCVFDEVSAMSGAEFEKKQALVRERNLKGGVTLKYGLALAEAEKGGAKKIIPDDAEHLPLFYVALPKDRIEKGLKEFIPAPDRQSEFEKKLFEYFIAAITLQIQALELYNNRLDPTLKTRLQNFKKVVHLLRGK